MDSIIRIQFRRDEYTVADLEALIAGGLIKVSDELERTGTAASIVQNHKRIKPAEQGFSTIEQRFLKNCYDPMQCDEKLITDRPGNYIL